MQVLSAKIAESYKPAYGLPGKNGHCDDARRSAYLEGCFRPVLAPLLLDRWLNGIVLGVGLTLLTLVAAGLDGWQCPIRSTFGITCPGCGLTTAMILLVRGRWAAAVGMHAFAPLFGVVLATMVVAISLPAVSLRKLCTAVAVLERKTGISAIIILGMLFYWLLRVFVL